MLRLQKQTMWLLAAALIMPIAARAQQDPDEVQVRVYRLQYIDSHEARERIEEIFGHTDIFDDVLSLSADSRTNTLICRGRPGSLAAIFELLKEIDVQSMKSEGSIESIYKVKHRNASRIAEVVSNISSGHLHIAVDDHTNTLIMRGPANEITGAKNLLETLDVARSSSADGDKSSLLVTIYFIQANLGADAPCQLPKNLGGVAKAITEQGVGNCSVLGQVMARVRESEEFRMTGMIRSGTADLGPAHVNVRGHAFVTGGGGMADMSIESEIVMPVKIKGVGGAEVTHQDFSIQTTAPVPVGEYLVLGAIPTTLEQADTVMMVIRIQ